MFESWPTLLLFAMATALTIFGICFMEWSDKQMVKRQREAIQDKEDLIDRALGRAVQQGLLPGSEPSPPSTSGPSLLDPEFYEDP